jgi:hypothetical protein
LPIAAAFSRNFVGEKEGEMRAGKKMMAAEWGK